MVFGKFVAIFPAAGSLGFYLGAMAERLSGFQGSSKGPKIHPTMNSNSHFVVSKSLQDERFLMTNTPRTIDKLTSLDSFLAEEGKRETFQAIAIKEVLDWQIE
jgi:hypothetical protein